MVNGTGIQADSASVSITNNLLEGRAVGYNGIIDMPPNGPITSNVSINYYVKTDLDPIYLTSSGLKSYVFEGPVAVNVGGLSAPAYLESYSVKVVPNSLVQASASFIVFGKMNGYLHPKYYEPNYTGTNMTGQGHAWTTSISSDTSILDFGYSFSARWMPKYKVGSANLVNAIFNGGTESFSFTKETFIQPTFSGQTYDNYLTSPTITLNSLNSDCGYAGNSITFNASNSKITQSDVSASIKNTLKTSTTLVKYF